MTNSVDHQYYVIYSILFEIGQLNKLFILKVYLMINNTQEMKEVPYETAVAAFSGLVSRVQYLVNVSIFCNVFYQEACILFRAT